MGNHDPVVVSIDLCKINRPIKILTACTKILKHKDTVYDEIFLNWDFLYHF